MNTGKGSSEYPAKQYDSENKAIRFSIFVKNKKEFFSYSYD